MRLKDARCRISSMLGRLREEGGVLRYVVGTVASVTFASCFASLLANAELPDDRFIALGVVSFEVVEQATPLADQHEQAAARAVVLLVRLEVVCQLANAFTDDGDLNLRTPGVSRVRLVLVDDRFLLLSG